MATVLLRQDIDVIAADQKRPFKPKSDPRLRSITVLGMGLTMTRIMRRREFLNGTVALIGAKVVGGVALPGIASAATIAAPVIDKLAIQVIVDAGSEFSFTPSTVNGVSIERVRASGVCRSTSKRNARTSSGL